MHVGGTAAEIVVGIVGVSQREVVIAAAAGSVKLPTRAPFPAGTKAGTGSASESVTVTETGDPVVTGKLFF